MAEDQEAREGEERPEDLLHVALCREADDLRAMHRLIGLKRGEEPWVYYDCSGVPALTSPVDALLSVCGFAGAPPPRPQVRTLKEDEVSCVPLLGFTVPRAMYPAVRTAIQQIMSGQIGGFSPILVAQSGFHDAGIDVLSYVWSQAERPPLWVRAPGADTRGGGASVPEGLLPHAHGNASFRASDYLRRVSRGGR